MSQGYRLSPSCLWEISETETTQFQSTIGLHGNYFNHKGCSFKSDKVNLTSDIITQGIPPMPNEKDPVYT